MVAKAGDALPDVQVDELVGGEIKKVSLKDLFAGKKGVLFGVPGAYTPGCSKTHLPGYVSDAEKLKEAGAEVVACVSVNDPFVMAAWGEANGADGKVAMLADTRAELTKALRFELEGLVPVLGNVRCRRFSAVVQDGKLKTLNLEAGGELTCSLSNQILDQLKQ
ncbi:Peroxiredoxin-mitochondrial [Micractinium conductrix]|uniref:Glutaredoxin-dependent peroxiredoxin n=1 Tax=Micractinium conductrix TaxID=554055 RepID=A0A2P6VIK6_9CHLO|nr:Peroxiredoxin-mitochondrial [Micractinium conductrix]|eukprot:PSC73925.1 Peroxiredoxin-mitochondrial [Micractinium conductrix]